MGYEPEDLPWEVPLIELGLDSLMAVRIKNRVEYDFDLPPIQLTAVRDANLYAVEKLIHYAIEHRDEVAGARRGPEDPDRRGDRGGSGRVDGRRDDGRRARGQSSPRPGIRWRGAGRRSADDPAAADSSPARRRRIRRRRRTRPPAEAVRPRAQPEPAARGAGAQPAGGRRGAELRRAAARRRRAGHLRDVGDRHRQVAGRHLQPAARRRRRRRRRRWRSGCRSAPRAPSPPTT